jgi:hypothetical protein
LSLANQAAAMLILITLVILQIIDLITFGY